MWHDVRKDHLCSVLRDYKIEHIDCDVLLPYICEKCNYISNIIIIISHQHRHHIIIMSHHYLHVLCYHDRHHHE